MVLEFSVCLLALTLTLQPLCAFAAPAPPSFEAFAVATRQSGSRAEPILSDSKSRIYAAELQDAAGRAPNFAGHFVLASWGCGASCVMAAALDSETGAVAWLPFTVCCWPKEIEEPLDFRRGSRLLIVHGSRDEKGEGTNFYAFDGKSFLPVGAADARP